MKFGIVESVAVRILNARNEEDGNSIVFDE